MMKEHCYRKNCTIDMFYQSVSDFTKVCEEQNYKYHLEMPRVTSARPAVK